MQDYVYLKEGLQLYGGVKKLNNPKNTINLQIESANFSIPPKHSINEILDKVEAGDISILDELNIPYTEITTDAGDKKYSFKYEDTRYTVNIIEAEQENNITEPTNNTETVKNDDGSYTIFEYNPDGSLAKSSEYDASGKISHEYLPNNDGSYSDKYYTYENGSLSQIQETIHYQNGNYTYIFTDGNGNIKEEQKVINNEYGGLTFDTTFEDGKRHVIAYDTNNQIKNEAFYSKDGNIEKTQEYDYDINNPNQYTITVKNADGQTTSEEAWENFNYTDENGQTWYGSRINQRINFDEKGDISEITRFENVNGFSSPSQCIHQKDEEFVGELKNIINDYQEQLTQITNQVLSLPVPTPPRAEDFKLSSNGNIDEKAYETALQAYFDKKTVYQTNVDELNKKAFKIQAKIQKINKQIAEVENGKVFDNIENSLNKLKSTVKDNELITLLNNNFQKIKQNLSNTPNKKQELEQKLQNTYNQILDTAVPTPPKAEDFKLSSNGNIDEIAYNNAFNDYLKEKAEYDKKINQLEQEVANLQSEIQKTEIKTQNQTNEFEQFKNNINAIETVQNVINDVKTKGNNDILVSKLNTMLSNLYENIKAQDKINQEMQSLQEDLLAENIPTPPIKNDKISEQEYDIAYNQYQKEINEYDKKMMQYNLRKEQVAEKLNSLINQVNGTVFSAKMLAELAR